MNPTITAFEESLDRGQGLARDEPVRWALEEWSGTGFRTAAFNAWPGGRFASNNGTLSRICEVQRSRAGAIMDGVGRATECRSEHPFGLRANL